jgi:hypothetical protein
MVIIHLIQNKPLSREFAENAEEKLEATPILLTSRNAGVRRLPSPQGGRAVLNLRQDQRMRRHSHATLQTTGRVSGV